MAELNRILVLAGVIIFSSLAYSQETTTVLDTTIRKLDTAKAEPSLPVKCTQVINIGYRIGGLAVDSKGNYYVNGGRGINAVTIFNPMGEKTGDFILQDAQIPPPSENQSSIRGIDIDLNENIYLCNAGYKTVEKFTKIGDFLKKISLPVSPKPEWNYALGGVVVDEEGTIYVAAYTKIIYIFDKEGNFLRQWVKSDKEKDQYGYVRALAIDRYKTSKLKRIYVGDDYTNRVYVFTKKERKLLFSLGSRGSSPGEMLDITDLDVDSDGNIFVLDRGMGYCSVFNNEGKFLFRFGQGDKSGEKNLAFPLGIFIDQKNKIHISNTEKGNILVWEWRKDK
ncbi:MAG: 6-bladed beta-propeller [bacterium]